MGYVRRVEPGFSPLDDELGLVSGSLTPALYEHVVRLGASLPFAQASREIEAFRRVSVSRSTVRRHTLQAGGASAKGIEQDVERLQREAPEPPLAPDCLVFSVDGAMVPLVGGEWAEVKTLAIGQAKGRRDDGTVETEGWSYFSRLADAATFERLALWETDRRGLATAGQVAAVVDGAEWIQGFIDYHRPDAIRILDFPHAAQRASAVGDLLGEGPEGLSARLHQWKETGPGETLADWRKVYQDQETLGDVSGGLREAMRAPLLYLEKREAQMQYPRFLREGWPLGSGSVESANKLVVEARLKGAGMHWKRENVNPILVLRNALCSDRWDDAWLQMITALRDQQTQQRKRKGDLRRAQLLPAPSPSDPAPSPSDPATSGRAIRQALQSPTASRQNATPASPSIPQATAPHPWRRFREPSTGYFSSSAKL